MGRRMFLAKALFDNIAESPDELAFRRGDVITVTELDTGGLDGWWLCTLRGKQGIAPGNRLKILSGMSDYSHLDEPTGSNTSLNRTSTGSLDKLLDKSRKDNFINDPNNSMTDYDVPPSRYTVQDRLGETELKPPDHLASRRSIDSLDSELSSLDLSLYDTPPSQRVPAGDLSDAYDVPAHALTAASSNELLSNRSSFLSDASNESSRASSFASNSNLLCSPMPGNSPRTSADISSQEIYDTPVTGARPTILPHPECSINIYDAPPPGKRVSAESISADYDRPREKEQEKLCLEHAVDDIYDVPHNNAPLPVKKGLGTVVHAVPGGNAKNRGTDQLCVYDIPPQVTRDSVISARSDSSEENQRLSTSSIDSRGSLTDIPVYDVLPLELDAALELLTKHQQEIQRSVSKFLGYVSSSWRKKESLQNQLYDIKMASTDVKDLLSEFVTFAQGTLGNSAKLQDKKLTSRLFKHFNPLQNSHHLISSALKNLDEINWQPDILAEPLDSSKSDDLGQIVTVCKDLGGNVRKLASFIQGNCTLLFPRSRDLAVAASSETKVSDGPAAAKPPIGPKPDVAAKLPAKQVQQRPLPPPPVAGRPLPPTPLESQMKQLRMKFEDDGEYCNDKNQSNEDIYVYDTGEWIRDYDYVHLDTKDVPVPPQGDNDVNSDEASPSESEQDRTDNSAQLEDSYEKKLEEDLENIDTVSREDGIDQVDHPDPEPSVPVKEDVVKIVKTDDNMHKTYQTEDIDFKFENEQLDPNDKQVLVFYSGQMETHSTLLDNALDAFFCCVEGNEPPKVFISHSKFVVVSAHKLVFIGDTLHRNIMHTNVKNKIMKCANRLCDCLKLSVSATKVAALQYPSVPPVQDMVDKVVEVSKAAHRLKLVISQAASL